jgi:hypothetical protein
MDHTRDMEAQDPFDARYLAFLETITQLERWREGRAGAFDALVPIVYDDLRQLFSRLRARPCQ